MRYLVGMMEIIMKGVKVEVEEEETEASQLEKKVTDGTECTCGEMAPQCGTNSIH